MLYDVWYTTVEEPVHVSDAKLFICDLPLNIARRVADNLEQEGFVLEAWIQES